MIARKSARYGVQLPAACRDQTVSRQGTVVNLSLGGCAILMEPHPAVGSYWALTIEAAGEDRPLEIDLAAVRWCQGNRCGMEFIKVREEKKTALMSFVQRLETPGSG